VNATELAQHLNVSKARVSQYVSSGVLDGCFQGDGRNRRFDLTAVQHALKKGLHPGQMLGNGADTRQALKTLAAAPPPAPSPKTDRALEPNDLDRYELAKIQSAEEDARRKRRDNQRDEGRWVLAEEVQRQTARLLAQEVAQFEVALRDAARAIADRLGVDARAARAVLMDVWRSHRGQRAAQLSGAAASAAPSQAEQEADA
jgi:hypothetical protein